ncbi:MAG: hypothetical protein ABI833_03350 [Acidobacteriota bacterium]
MIYSDRFRFALIGVAAIAALGATKEPNAQPNSCSTIENYFRIPEGRTWESAAGVSVDSEGAFYGAEVGPKDLKKYVKK